MRTSTAVSPISFRIQMRRRRKRDIFPHISLAGRKEGVADQDPTRRRTTVQGNANVTVSDVHCVTTVMLLVSGTRAVAFPEERVAMFKFLHSHSRLYVLMFTTENNLLNPLIYPWVFFSFFFFLLCFGDLCLTHITPKWNPSISALCLSLFQLWKIVDW